MSAPQHRKASEKRMVVSHKVVFSMILLVLPMKAVMISSTAGGMTKNVAEAKSNCSPKRNAYIICPNVASPM